MQADHCPGSHLNGQGRRLHKRDVLGLCSILRSVWLALFLRRLRRLRRRRRRVDRSAAEEDRQNPSLTTLPPLLMSTH